MMRRHPGAGAPTSPLRTFRDDVHAGEIAWLSDAGCAGGYSIKMVAFDEPPWDRWLDRPIGAMVCRASL